MIPQVSTVVFTFNGYSHLWDGFFKAYQEHGFIITDATYHRKYFLVTDEKTNFTPPLPWKKIYTGTGEWSDRLIRAIEQIEDDFILLLQEDHWLTSIPPNLSLMMSVFTEKDLLRLQLSGVNQFYSLFGHRLPLFFHHTSKYLVSHQPSIWRKDFLLSCLLPGETPWVNEYEGTKRLQKRPEIQGKIAIYPCDWYTHKCIKGQVVD
jgi:hypothetical protein